MAELKHTIKYRYVCEQCGKQTDWFTLDIEGEKHHGTLVQQAVQNIAENAQARLDEPPRGKPRGIFSGALFQRRLVR
jgi:hypothetical protein